MGLVFSTGKGSGFLPNFYLLMTVLPKHSVLKSLCSHVSQKYEETQRWGISGAQGRTRGPAVPRKLHPFLPGNRESAAPSRWQIPSSPCQVQHTQPVPRRIPAACVLLSVSNKSGDWQAFRKASLAHVTLHCSFYQQFLYPSSFSLYRIIWRNNVWGEKKNYLRQSCYNGSCADSPLGTVAAAG